MKNSDRFFMLFDLVKEFANTREDGEEFMRSLIKRPDGIGDVEYINLVGDRMDRAIVEAAIGETIV